MFVIAGVSWGFGGAVHHVLSQGRLSRPRLWLSNGSSESAQLSQLGATDDSEWK